MIHTNNKPPLDLVGKQKYFSYFFALFYRLSVWYLKIRWFTTNKKPNPRNLRDLVSERVQADCHNYFHLKWLVFYYDLLILIILLPSSIESLWPHCCVCHYLFRFRWLGICQVEFSALGSHFFFHTSIKLRWFVRTAKTN